MKYKDINMNIIYYKCNIKLYVFYDITNPLIKYIKFFIKCLYNIFII